MKNQVERPYGRLRTTNQRKHLLVGKHCSRF